MKLVRTDAFLLTVAILVAGQATAEFPELTGRVVDSANMLSSSLESELVATLAQHEQETTNQVVVATIPSLEGMALSQYSVDLSREWQLGQANRDNGVLLLIAQEERKVRIEVGYGLEGVLTDVISFDIINRIIQPAFRQGDFDGGVRNSVSAILAAIKGEYVAQPQPRRVRKPSAAYGLFGLWLPIALMFFPIFLFRRRRRRGRGGSELGTGLLVGGLIGHSLGSNHSAGGVGGGFSGGGFGGFAGGGGSFGGGGASGGW